MGLLDGKTGLVFGVANKRSIAWAIAQALAGAGMRLAFTYQGDRLRENVESLAVTLPVTRQTPRHDPRARRVMTDNGGYVIYALVGVGPTRGANAAGAC